MFVPDIVGFTLADAREMLEKCGLNICSIQMTAPPRAGRFEHNNRSRVIRVKIIEEKNVELLVCNPGEIEKAPLC